MKYLWKEVYAALEVKHIAFKLYKENNNDIFEFMNNKIVLSNDNITVNDIEYNSVQDVVSFIKNY